MYQYDDAECRQLATQHYALEIRILAGEYNPRELGVRTLCELHRQIFDGVRGFAGKVRGPGEGQEYLEFGPNRSVHRDRVSYELASIFVTLRGRQAELLAASSPDRHIEAITLAVWAHAEIVRVHPFNDGNGRTSRALMGVVLVRLGLSIIPVDACKTDYLNCLNHYFREGDLRPATDLFVRIASERLGP